VTKLHAGVDEPLELLAEGLVDDVPDAELLGVLADAGVPTGALLDAHSALLDAAEVAAELELAAPGESSPEAPGRAEDPVHPVSIIATATPQANSPRRNAIMMGTLLDRYSYVAHRTIRAIRPNE